MECTSELQLLTTPMCTKASRERLESIKDCSVDRGYEQQHVVVDLTMNSSMWWWFIEIDEEKRTPRSCLAKPRRRTMESQRQSN